MTDATKATPLSADIQPKISEYTSPGVQTPPPAIPQDQLTGKTHGRNPSRARAREVKAVGTSLLAIRTMSRSTAVSASSADGRPQTPLPMKAVVCAEACDKSNTASGV